MSKGLTKGELMQSLKTARTSKERNRVVKLLKQFTRRPKHQYDNENSKSLFKIKEYQNLEAFMCFRCDGVKQALVKVFWTTSKGQKVICLTCHNHLLQSKAIEDNKGVPKAFLARLARSGTI